MGGVETALFVEPPDAETLERYPHVRAIGIAGNSRTMSPAKMDSALPHVFRSLLEHRPAVVHYKTCSTFDSSPETGSIGRAIDIGQRTFANRFVPVVVGVPQLQRFCVFGNLFARSGLDSAPYRLDRHPTMRHHPVTPMTEADLRLHLARQTTLPIELLDVLTLDSGDKASREALVRLTAVAGCVVLFDTLTNEHLNHVGRLIWESQSQDQKPLFAVGSSGIEYALTGHWQANGTVSNTSRLAATNPPPVDRAVVISGSCSPVTKRQIAWALDHGFDEVRLDATRLHRSAPVDADLADIVHQTLSILERGRSVIVHTFGDLTTSLNGASVSSTSPNSTNGEVIGTKLGRILRDVARSATIQRAAVIGGDTSGCVARSLGIDSLEMIAPLERGAPLCAARSRDPAIDRLEVVFKGGQVGYEDFFGSLLGERSPCTSVGLVQ